MKTAVIFGAAPIKNYETVKKYPHNGALQYYGKTLSYKKLYDKIENSNKTLLPPNLATLVFILTS